MAWKQYLKLCESVGNQPEAAVETNMQQQYKTLYTRYCTDNGLPFDPSRNLDSDIDIKTFSEFLYVDLREMNVCSIMLEVGQKDLGYLYPIVIKCLL